MRFKTTIIGAGNVGATTAQRLVETGLFDVAIVDIQDGLASGKALDLQQSASALGVDGHIQGGSNYSITANSDIIVVTAGITRKPGMSRDDLLLTNAKIVNTVVEKSINVSPNAIIIVVSNPLDAMVHSAFKKSGFPKNRVLGMAGILDTARFKTFIASELNVSVKEISAYVLGGHGDLMVPLLEATTVGGTNIRKLIPAQRLNEIVQRTRDGGAEVVKTLGTSAYYAPAAAIVEMVKAIILNQGRILPCSAYLEGEYGITGLFCGVPVKLGRHGVEKVIEIELTEDEAAALRKSSDAVRSLIHIIEIDS